MRISKDEAARALAEIETAGGAVRRVQGYAKASPYLIVWGVAWACADAVWQFEPSFRAGWIIATSLGGLATANLGFAQSRAAGADRARAWRELASWLAVIACIASVLVIVPPTRGNQVHTVIALVFGYVYMVAGLWMGLRLFVLGAALVALTFVGFYELGRWYPLYMGLVGGGALVLGGLWLRKL